MFWGGGGGGGGGEFIVLAWGSAFVSWGEGRKKKTNPQARAPPETKEGGKRKRQRNTSDFGLQQQQQQHVHSDERCKGSGWDFAEDRVCAQGFIWAASSLKWGWGGHLLRNAFASLLQIGSAQLARQRRVVLFYVFAQSCRSFCCCCFC